MGFSTCQSSACLSPITCHHTLETSGCETPVCIKNCLGDISEVPIQGLQLKPFWFGTSGWHCAFLTSTWADSGTEDPHNTEKVAVESLFYLSGKTAPHWLLAPLASDPNRGHHSYFHLKNLAVLDHQIISPASCTALCSPHVFGSISPAGTLSRGDCPKEQINQWSWDLSGSHLHLNGNSTLLLSQSHSLKLCN